MLDFICFPSIYLFAMFELIKRNFASTNNSNDSNVTATKNLLFVALKWQLTNFLINL